MKNSSPTFVVIDGNSIMYRAYHGVGKGFVPVWNEMPVGMVYGFALTLIHTLDHFRPDSLAITFDTKEKTFRHQMCPEYKAQRTAAPDDFYPQIPLIHELADCFQIKTLAQPGFESDDLIGSLVQLVPDDLAVRIVSLDLDFTQLLTERIKLVKVRGKIADSPIYGPEETIARFGVRPDQMVDFKAITGDSSDNFKYSNLSDIKSTDHK